jgi:hypothetical protein
LQVMNKLLRMKFGLRIPMQRFLKGLRRINDSLFVIETLVDIDPPSLDTKAVKEMISKVQQMRQQLL